MKISILTIGDELLIGQVVNTNAAWMGKYCNQFGGTIEQTLSVSDEEKSILDGIEFLSKTVDVVLITGGLGPTKDDITKKVLASYFDDKLIFDESSFNRIQIAFDQRGIPITDAHKQQCYMPSKATLFTNLKGTAPAMWLEKNGIIYVSMPGVPFEMKYLMEHEVLPKIIERFPQQTVLHETILVAGIGESTVAQKIEDIEDALPPSIAIAYLPSLECVKIRLSTKGNDKKYLERELVKWKDKIVNRLGTHVFGFNNQTLHSVVSDLLKEKKLKLSIAESCSGGFISHSLTKEPGASAFFDGGIVSYDNRLKVELLGVKKETLDNYGAVSEQTVIEMAEGVVKVCKTDVSISISGIAGPTGGTELKPVGTIWMAVSDGKNTQTRKLQLGKDRWKNIQYATSKALFMLKCYLDEYV